MAALAAVTVAARRSKISSSSAERAVGGVGDLGFEFAEFGGGEAHLAGQRLAVDEGRVERRAHQLLAVLGGDVDEIAEHVVVPDLQRADAGRLGVTHLQRGDDAARIRRAARAPRRAPARSRRARSRRRGGTPAARPRARAQVRRRSRRRAGAAPRRLARCRAALSASAASRAAMLGGGKNAVADRGEIARAAAADHDARQRAGEIGRRLEPRAQRRRARAASSTKAATASSRCAISAGSVSGAASRCASSREPAAVTVRSMAASSEPRRSPVSVRISSRLPRVAWSIASVAPARSRTGGDSGGRLPSCVRST